MTRQSPIAQALTELQSHHWAPRLPSLVVDSLPQPLMLSLLIAPLVSATDSNQLLRVDIP